MKRKTSNPGPRSPGPGHSLRSFLTVADPLSGATKIPITTPASRANTVLFIIVALREPISALRNYRESHQGVLLARRSSFDSMVFLFQPGSYYVEAYCNPANKA